MNRLVFAEPELAALRQLALSERVESCGTGLVARGGDGRFVVRAFSPVAPELYSERSAKRAILKPEACLALANQARLADCGVLLAHTHLGESDEQPHFSRFDDEGERMLAAYFNGRIPLHEHFAAVVAPSGSNARGLGAGAQTDVIGIGSNVVVAGASPGYEGQPLYDRQIRAFGSSGQATLQQTRVAIVGLGGTGSIVAQELAYLGVRDYLLVDPDVVEDSNLNRLLGAIQADIGSDKVDVAARAIKRISPKANLTPICGDVTVDSVAKQLLGTDFIFLCTDSHASRAIVNQLAYQYLVPAIDVGVAIHVRDARIENIAGRVQMLAPGLACLLCGNWLDANQVRTEMMSDEDKKRDPYFVGIAVPQPAVISINGLISSAAVTMFLSAVVGIPSAARLLLYDGMRSALRPTLVTPDRNCIVCSGSGAQGRGDVWPLPTRRE